MKMLRLIMEYGLEDYEAAEYCTKEEIEEYEEFKEGGAE